MDATQLSNQVALALAKLRTHVVSLEKKLEEKEEDFEEKAIQYVYEHTGEYDDWVKGSTLYQELEKEVSLINSEEMENEEKIARLEAENKKLKEDITANPARSR